MLPKQEGLRLRAANGTEIPNLGRKVTPFKGDDVRKPKGEASDFNRRV